MRDGLIVERLNGEMLVYDTASREAHRLDAEASAEFEAAPDDVSRREVIRRLALAGAAAVGAAQLVTTIVAPSPAQAQTCVNPGPLCNPVSNPCCPGFGCVGDCFPCLPPGASCTPSDLCCSAGALFACPGSGTCPIT
jgi:hypothetical protein